LRRYAPEGEAIDGISVLSFASVTAAYRDDDSLKH
jgi:hypothetical protein